MKRLILVGFAFCFSLSVQAQGPRVAPAAGPSLAEALSALSAANESAEDLGISLSCAVLDSTGNTVASTKMDGAGAFTVNVAAGKALVSSMFGAPSAAMSEMAESPFFASLNATTGNRLFAVQGALPIVRNNLVIGAMGCSGATGQQDEDAARVGIEAM